MNNRMKHEDYKLIPLSEISDDARKIAVLWHSYTPIGFDIQNKHKLASDIMNYSNVQLSEYKTKLKRAINDIPCDDWGLKAVLKTIDDLLKSSDSQATDKT